jgi:hypothetical protein
MFVRFKRFKRFVRLVRFVRFMKFMKLKGSILLMGSKGWMYFPLMSIFVKKIFVP